MWFFPESPHIAEIVNMHRFERKHNYVYMTSRGNMFLHSYYGKEVIKDIFCLLNPFQELLLIRRHIMVICLTRLPHARLYILCCASPTYPMVRMPQLDPLTEYFYYFQKNLACYQSPIFFLQHRSTFLPSKNFLLKAVYSIYILCRKMFHSTSNVNLI